MRTFMSCVMATDSSLAASLVMGIMVPFTCAAAAAASSLEAWRGGRQEEVRVVCACARARVKVCA